MARELDTDHPVISFRGGFLDIREELQRLFPPVDERPLFALKENGRVMTRAGQELPEYETRPNPLDYVTPKRGG